MARYIDADALIDFLDVGHLRHPSELCFSEVDVANLLLHTPTISPDEVRGVGEWEEVKEITSWSYGPFHKKMGDWLKAEHEGRLVVLPCKVGDTVYTFYNGKNCKWPTNMKRRKIYETLVSGIRLHDWDADDWRLLLLFDTREASGCYEFSFSEVGKTVFLTSAEAEKAMVSG